MARAPKRRHVKAQPHPTNSGRTRYVVIEHTDNGGRREVGRYDSPIIARGAADLRRKSLPRGSSAWFTVHKIKRG